MIIMLTILMERVKTFKISGKFQQRNGIQEKKSEGISRNNPPHSNINEEYLQHTYQQIYHWLNK